MKLLAILSILAAMTFAMAISLADEKPGATTQATQTASSDRVVDAFQQKIHQKIQKLTFSDTELENVIMFYRDIAGVSFQPDWKMLEKAGVDRTAPVTIDRKDVRLDNALQEILDGLKAKKPLGFAIVPGGLDGFHTAIVISTKDVLADLRDRELALAAVVKSTDAFATDLYVKLAASTKGNFLFSPCCIHTALAMTYAGAAGNTADQMAKTLHITLPADKLGVGYAGLLNVLNNPPDRDALVEDEAHTPAYQFVVTNALWGQKGYLFKPPFTQLLQKSYGAEFGEVDFAKPEQAAKAVNDWVAKRTKDRIKEIMVPGDLSDSARLVLTNAVYLKARWEMPFCGDAKNSPFNLSADKSVDVPMMHQFTAQPLVYGENDQVQMLQKPCMGDALWMTIVLPKKVGGLADFETTLTSNESFKADWKDASVDITLPRFRFSSAFTLTDTLKAMGMTDAFNAGKADLSGMTDKDKTFISAIIHKAFVAVDEEGIEVGAADGAFHILGLPGEPKVFKADHPFMFIIRHNSTGEILFMGRVANPKSE
jgi:serpin B